MPDPTPAGEPTERPQDAATATDAATPESDAPAVSESIPEAVETRSEPEGDVKPEEVTQVDEICVTEPEAAQPEPPADAAPAGWDNSADPVSPPAAEAEPQPEPQPRGRSARPRPARSGRYKYRDLPFQTTKTSDDGSYFEGYAAVLNNIDEYNTIMARGCFDQDLESFRTDGFFGGLNHNWDDPIGTPSVVRLDDKGLFVGGNVLDTAHGLDCRKWLRARVVKKMSFGFDVIDQEFLDDAAAVSGYWKSVGYTPTATDLERADKVVVLFKRIKVYEASPVMVPGNQLADITAVRSGDDAESPYLPLESHLLAVHDAAGELCDRLEHVASLRGAQGRSLAKDKFARLREIRDRIDSALAACQPRAKPTDVAALRRELLTLSARVHRPTPR